MTSIAELKKDYDRAARQFAELNAIASAVEADSPASQAREKAATARAICDVAFKALDLAVGAAAEEKRQAALREAYARKTQEFETCRATLLAQRAQLAELIDAVDFGAKLHDSLLRELAGMEKP